jgi:hypothetical protein
MRLISTLSAFVEYAEAESATRGSETS